MNKQDNLMLFFKNFLKNNNSYDDKCLADNISNFTLDRANDWMKIYNDNIDQLSYTCMENDWKLCADYIEKHNIIRIDDSHLKMDNECYSIKPLDFNECGGCIFEECSLTTLCECITCDKGIYIKDVSTGKKYDADKTRYDLLPPEIMKEIAEILTFGAAKYGDNNWQKLEDFNNRYYAAMERHIQAWRMGEDFDPESGKHHLSHALTNVAFLVWKNINKE